MARRKIALTNRKQRSVLTDMLPFEVPPTFSNRGFYRFIKDNGVEAAGGKARWISTSPAVDSAIQFLFGVKAGAKIESETLTEWGRTKTVKSVSLSSGCRMDTIPFNFRVAHNLDGRTLSVVHPRNQIEVAGFYADHSALLTYHCSKSSFSIRRPVSVSRFAFYKDKLHEQRLETLTGEIEEEDREYEQLGSYFVYKNYRNIHRFFESYQYHRAEKKYDAMMQVDISKCFDSIYTHSISWAVLGKSQTKFHLPESKSTFDGHFDRLMQRLNHGETNGIVIGPEFSRIFAEIILQVVDVELERHLDKVGLRHKTDYEIFRYVDDYFIFYNSPSTQLKAIETLQELLKNRKLSINSSKLKHYIKPIITEITVAKERVSSLLNSEISPGVTDVPAESGKPAAKRLECSINSNRLIIRFKAVLKASNVQYGDILNYTFAILENKIAGLQKNFLSSDREHIDRKRFIGAALSTLEFSFFIYSANPKVNHTIRLCRLVSTLVEFLNEQKFPYEMKHLIFKYVHDNIIQQLNKNTMELHREVESLYLLIALSQAGRDYWVPETTLAKHFRIEWKDAVASYDRNEDLSHFAITVLLSYIRNKVRYAKMKTFIEAHAIRKLDFAKAHCPNDAEAIMLFLDLIVCPYVSTSTKEAIAAIFGKSPAELATLQSVNDRWFTVWGDKFDVGKELDAKRSREVY